MSRIDKLSIQGIRSFGPDEEKRLAFYTPLTLILGQNGCGKTTIIESLKYVTTGEVPSGCARGAYFVHDPKLANESTVRGQIKLLFQTKRGNTNEKVVASRTLEVTQKAKTSQCKTLDATITRTLPNGQKQSISHKCADIQAEMSSMLGVSKAILENVIFCHQEDSNWPLDEGKKVKEKFDAIFNATKYIKCLDTIKKLRGDEKKRSTNMRETVDALQVTKEHAARMRRDLANVEKDEETINKEIKSFKELLKTIKERLYEIQEKENDIGCLQGELKQTMMELDSNKSLQDELKRSQTESFAVSDNELDQMIKEFERDDLEKQERLQRVEREINDVLLRIKDTQKRHSAELQKLGSLEAVHNGHLDNVKSLNRRIIDIIATHNFAEFKGNSFEYHEAEEVLKKLDQIIYEQNNDILTKRNYYKDKEDSIQQEIDSQRKEESSLENEIRNCSSKLSELSTRSHTARQSLQMIENELAFENITELRQAITSTTAEIEKEENSINVNKLQEEIEEKKKSMRLVDQEISDVKQSISRLTQQGKARAQHDIFKKKMQELQNGNKFLLRKNQHDFEYVFGKNFGENLRNELDCYIKRNQEKKKSVEDKMSSQEMKKVKLKFNIENTKSTIAKRESEISAFQDKLEFHCGSHSLETALNRTNEQLDALMRAEADKTSSTSVMTVYISKLREDEICPLCLRDFQTRDEVNRLIESLEKKMEELPEHLKQVKSKLVANKKKHEELLQLKPQEKQASEARKEVEKLKQELKKSQQELQTLDEEIEDITSSLEMVQSDECVSKRINSDVIEIDKHYKEINNIETKLEELNLDLNSSGCQLTMDELMKLQTEHENKIRKTRDEIDSTQKRILEHKDRLQKLKTKKLTLSSRELELQNKSKEAEKLKEELSQCDKDKTVFESRQEEFREKVAPLKYQIKDKLDSKKEIELKCLSWVDEANQKLDQLKEAHRKGFDRCKSVKEYILGEGKERLLQSRNQASSLTSDIKALEGKARTLSRNVEGIKDEIARKKDKKRNLDDELTIRRKNKDQQQLETKIKELRKNIQDSDYETLSQEKQTLIQENNRLINQNATSGGRLEELGKKKRELTTDLNRHGIRNAERDYKEKLIEMKCIEMATDDLNKYYKALYNGIMKFHSEKMATINRIIRELWRTTYKGNDIDAVEIKTDETESKGADKRQTYNYRVVMFKNDVEMDMRPRCSAGQKVLASLIIRIALAETFSVNCGILALDEPTTNLDTKNIEALALALLNIVNRRSLQRNFQLIVITHDEDFLNKLTKADFIEYYLEVSRDHRGLSTIKRQTALKY